MADSKVVKELDSKLMEQGVISKEYSRDYKIVHKMLNSYMKRTGKILTQKNFDRGNEKLRDWLMILHKEGASQEKLTSYLRCGLAHLSFDFIASQNRDLSNGVLVTRALQSFKGRNYHKSFFRKSPSKVTERISLKKKK
jgi:hypothetical protein